jgi:hypothetical protein
MLEAKDVREAFWREILKGSAGLRENPRDQKTQGSIGPDLD